MSILVSIFCITYNHEKYIVDALKSFLMQRTNFEFEILVHDDASTDNTANIIREYAKLHNCIKPIFQKENQYSQGRDIIMSHLYHKRKGKYIALCEGDDYWTDPYKLQKQVDYMEDHPKCSLCFHAAAIVNTNKQLTGNFIRPYHISCIVPIERFIEDGAAIICRTESMLFRAKSMEGINKVFSSKSFGDWLWQLFLATKGDVYYIDKVMSAYRIGVPNSWSNNVRQKSESEFKQLKIEFNNTLSEFDKYTNSKYANSIETSRNHIEFRDLLRKNELKVIKTLKYRKFYRLLSTKLKIHLYTRYYFPQIYNFYRSIRNKL